MSDTSMSFNQSQRSFSTKAHYIFAGSVGVIVLAAGVIIYEQHVAINEMRERIGTIEKNSGQPLPELSSLTNDVAKLSSQFSAIETSIFGINKEIAAIKNADVQADSLFSKIATKVVQTDKALAKLGETDAAVDERLAAVEQSADVTTQSIAGLKTDLSNTWYRVGTLSSQVSILTVGSERLSQQTDKPVKLKPVVADGLTSVGLGLFSPSYSDDPIDIPGIENATFAFISAVQRSTVRASYGTYEGECFSDKDLEVFILNKTAEISASKAKDTDDFKTLIAHITKMPPEKRETLYNNAAKVMRPTWAELGKISSEGQTPAGQKADALIAQALVKRIKEAVYGSIKEVRK